MAKLRKFSLMTLTFSVVASQLVIKFAITSSIEQPMSRFVTNKHLFLLALFLSAAFSVPSDCPEPITGGFPRSAARKELMWFADRLRWLTFAVFVLFVLASACFAGPFDCCMSFDDDAGSFRSSSALGGSLLTIGKTSFSSTIFG